MHLVFLHWTEAPGRLQGAGAILGGPVHWGERRDGPEGGRPQASPAVVRARQEQGAPRARGQGPEATPSGPAEGAPQGRVLKGPGEGGEGAEPPGKGCTETQADGGGVTEPVEARGRGHTTPVGAGEDWIFFPGARGSGKGVDGGDMTRFPG